MATNERIMLSNKLKELKKEKKYSYRDLENATGISRTTIMRYIENPETKISTENINKLANAFGFSPTELLGWQELTDDFLIPIDINQPDLANRLKTQIEEFKVFVAMYKPTEEEFRKIQDYMDFVISQRFK